MERELLPVWRHLRVQDLKRRDVARPSGGWGVRTYGWE
jgi:hypothetical protein